jgi:hypothetical protein
MKKYVRVGDYLVPKDDLKEAEESFSKRSKASRSRDRLSRAPIETDVEKWKKRQRWMDYPGVDTPKDTPRVSLLDERVDADRDEAGDVLFAPEERSLAKGVEEAGTMPPETWKRLRDAFTF